MKTVQRINENTAVVYEERTINGKTKVIPTEAHTGNKVSCNKFVKENGGKISNKYL